MNIQRSALIFVIILTSILVSTLLIKYIALRNATFIGKRAKRFNVYYNMTVIAEHIVIEVWLVVLTYVHKIFNCIAIIYMFISLYLIFVHLLKIRCTLREKYSNISTIDNVFKYIVIQRRYKESTLKLLTKYNEKIEFKISLNDAIRIQSILNKQAIVSKVSYYNSSGRLYGIELLGHRE